MLHNLCFEHFVVTTSQAISVFVHGKTIQTNSLIIPPRLFVHPGRNNLLFICQTKGTFLVLGVQAKIPSQTPEGLCLLTRIKKPFCLLDDFVFINDSSKRSLLMTLHVPRGRKRVGIVSIVGNACQCFSNECLITPFSCQLRQ